MTKATIAVLGIDLGKNSCSMAGLDITGAVVLRRKVTRDVLIAFAAALAPCTIAMEACCGAHFLGRTFAGNGHTVRLMSPEYVQPYVKAQKTDDRDAEAIAEAATRPTMRFVSLRSEAQLDLQVLHRARERLVLAGHGRHQPTPCGAPRARDHVSKGAHHPHAAPGCDRARVARGECSHTSTPGGSP